MASYKIVLEYDGTRYSGWQEQKNARTILGEVRRAAAKVLGAEVEAQGAGRTDAGVHALAQVAHLRVRKEVRLSPQSIRDQLNEILPADIVILHVESVPERFHARHDAVSRSYLYQISTRKQAFMKKHVWWVKEDLDIDRMRRACALFEGRHDFVCFRAPDVSRPEESTLVVVERVELEIQDEVILFRIEASHFLWRMVRRIVGALVRVGRGELTESDLRTLLRGRCDPRLDVASWTAPASGLFLEHVRYAAPDSTPRTAPSKVSAK